MDKTSWMIATLAAVMTILPASANEIVANPVTLELVSAVRSVAPGVPFTVGIAIHHSPGYHTYWHSPGTVGLPTMVKWQLPEGFVAGELQWPTPQRCKMVGYNTHGYERDVMLLAEITPPKTLPEGEFRLAAALTWMACSEARCCNLQSNTIALTLQRAAGGEPAPNPEAASAIAAARTQLPATMPGLKASFTQDRESYTLTIHFPTAAADLPAAEALYFYAAGTAVDTIRPQTVTRTKDGYQLILPRTEFAPDSLPALEGLLQQPHNWPGIQSAFISLAGTPE